MQLIPPVDPVNTRQLVTTPHPCRWVVILPSWVVSAQGGQEIDTQSAYCSLNGGACSLDAASRPLLRSPS